MRLLNNRAACVAAALIISMSLPSLADAQCTTTALRNITSPVPRFGASMAYHPIEQRLLVYGGERRWRASFDEYRIDRYSDTLAWNGTSWVQVASQGPFVGIDTRMVFDHARGQMLLIGPTAGTWAWTGSGWTQLAGGDQLPPRADPAVTFHAGRGTVMLFGGRQGDTNFADLWEWNGASWTQLQLAPSPPANGYPVMTYDAARNLIVLVEGTSTWELRGTTWTLLTNTPSIGAKAIDLAYDPQLARPLMLAEGWGTWRRSVFAWDGSAWAGVFRTDNDGGPYPITFVASAFNPRLGAFVTLGGYCGSYCTNDDTYEFTAPGVPSITSHPASVRTCAGGDAQISIAVRSNSQPTFRWKKRIADTFIDLTDGTTPGGSTILGSTSASLRVLHVGPADQGDYVCVVTGPCGSRTSLPATITVCTADFTCDGSVDFFDYLAFIDLFSQNQPDADINRNGTVDFFDYLDFVAAYEQRCP